MDVILLERVAKLGQMGESVRVKNGYARNFLLPRGKALRATEANKKRFESQKATLEARNLQRKSEAEHVAAALTDKSFIIIRQAGETGQLYGSVSTRDIADAISAEGVTISRTQIVLNAPIKALGLYTIPLDLHAEIALTVTINVARSPEEAERQTKGEVLNTKEETNLDDLGLEIGAVMAEQKNASLDQG